MAKVLVIEDESILREEMVEWLTFEGFDAISAKDGLAGVEAALNNLPDLIVCDITMPKMNGYDVLLEIHSHAETVSIPFIFLTARASHEDIRYGMELGADDYITKPFTRQELLQAIQTRLGKKMLLEEEYHQQLNILQDALSVEREQRILKTKLIAMLSHDFRNPLTSILSSTELLRNYFDRMDETRRNTHMDRIETSVQRLVDMIDDLLLIAKMETGNFELNLELLDLDDFFSKLVDEFQVMHRKTHNIRFENQKIGMVKADMRLLRQITANLLSNAIKYSSEGSDVLISLKTEGEHWVFIIQDHGIGIPQEDQAKLFSDFKRGSNVEGIAGTGLGLAIVKQATELHGGQIHLKSEVDIGTTIQVMIPLQNQ